MKIRNRRSEQGSALLVAIMVLMLLQILAIAALQTTMRDEQVASLEANRRVAFNAAEAGVARVLATVGGSGTPTIPDETIGDSTLHPGGLPSYGPDPTAAQAVENLGSSSASGMNLNLGGGGPKFQQQFWRFRVEGRAPNGTVSRIEFATSTMASGT